MKISYYAIFQYDIDGICISFPDIPSALTCADNETDGLKYAKEALELSLHKMLVNEVPLKSPANQIVTNENQKLFFISVELELKEGRLYSQNVTEL